jgi:hypothetical protein
MASILLDSCYHIVSTYEQDLTDGAIITADPERIRIRSA